MNEEQASAAGDWGASLIRRIIAACGPREPGSTAERKAQDMVAEELRPFVDTVALEPFTVKPRAFLRFMPITSVLLVLAVAAYWLLPYSLVGLGLAALGAIVAICQFLFYRQLLDPLFPGRTSHNLIGTRMPKGATKRRFILSGHIDSAYEWPFSYYLGVWAVRLVIAGTIIGSVVVLFSGLARLLFDGIAVSAPAGVWFWAGLVQVVFLPCFIGLFFFVSYRRVVPGANDNLTGVVAALAVAKHLHETAEQLEHTELRVISMGSEEAGLRGAKAYAARHRDDLSAVPTVFVALETFRDDEHMAVYNRDMSGLVQHDPAASRLLTEAGKRCGRDLSYATIYVGASDAAAFSQAGIPAAALAAMDPAPPRYYHTRLDDVNNLNPACIAQGIRIALEATRRFDAEGLPAEDA
ncbi:MAG: M28 family metallopeptidase [Candidatus Hydrogenedentota bacterium]